MIRAATPLLATLILVACTSGGPTDAELEARLLEADDLSTAWTSADELATAVAGGFCDLDEVVRSTDPLSKAAATYVDGEVMLRQNLFGYATQTDAVDARASIEQQLVDCPTPGSGGDLGIVVSEPASWAPDTTRLRLEVEVADVPLVLDLAIWQQHDMVGVLRLTYPSDALDDPLSTHQTVTTTAQTRSTD